MTTSCQKPPPFVEFPLQRPEGIEPGALLVFLDYSPTHIVRLEIETAGRSSENAEPPKPFDNRPMTFWVDIGEPGSLPSTPKLRVFYRGSPPTLSLQPDVGYLWIPQDRANKNSYLEDPESGASLAFSPKAKELTESRETYLRAARQQHGADHPLPRAMEFFMKLDLAANEAQPARGHVDALVEGLFEYQWDDRIRAIREGDPAPRDSVYSSPPRRLEDDIRAVEIMFRGALQPAICDLRSHFAYFLTAELSPAHFSDGTLAARAYRYGIPDSHFFFFFVEAPLRFAHCGPNADFWRDVSKQVTWTLRPFAELWWDQKRLSRSHFGARAFQAWRPSAVDSARRAQVVLTHRLGARPAHDDLSFFENDYNQVYRDLINLTSPAEEP